MPLKYFNELKVGETLTFRQVTLTQKLRDKHVRLYGEDWPEENSRAKDAKEKGIIPSTLVISLLGGLMGKANWLAVHFLMSYEVFFEKPLFVGDTIETVCRVTHKRRAVKKDKPYGIVYINQRVYKLLANQERQLVYQRLLRYDISKKIIKRD